MADLVGLRARAKTRLSLALGLALVTMGLGAQTACAEPLSPWFHLASMARPGNLRSGAVGDEVYELTVSATGGEFVLIETKTFTPVFFKWNATHEEVQQGLEGVVGAGNVEVTGGPGDEEGSKPYTIRFGGALTNKPVSLNGEFSRFFLNCEGAEGAGCGQSATLLEKEKGGDFIVASAVNVGEADVNGSAAPVKLVDELPPGLQALTVEANTRNSIGEEHGPLACTVASTNLVECSFEGKLPPYQQIEVVIGVEPQGGAHSGEENEVRVEGGEAPATHVRHPIVVDDAPTPFGVEQYELAPEEVGGSADTQAGSHPFQLTSTFNVKQQLELNALHNGEAKPAGLAKDVAFKLPAGLIGNPTADPRCTLAQFEHFKKEFQNEENECPPASVVGVASVTYAGSAKLGGQTTATLPLYNLEPAQGEPARFGFQPAKIPVLLDTSVRTGEDYGVTVHATNISEAVGFLSSTVTFWGVPGDARHDSLRDIGCLSETAESTSTHAPCQPLGEAHPQPFLSLPTSCSGENLQTSGLAYSWAEPGAAVGFEPLPGEQLPALDGCGKLPFAAQITASPDESAGSTPSGLKVDVHVPQEEALNANGLAPADVKNITVALPQGMALNPASADGLSSCSLAQIGYKGENPATHAQEFTPDEPSCPDASKIGVATLKLPILPKGQDVTGFVYLASPQNFGLSAGGSLENPFGSLIAMYLVARDPVSGILVKLPGRVALSSSGQITTTFENNPQAPFEDAEVEFLGGERAPLATPAHCTSYTTVASFEPWTNTLEHHEALNSQSTFSIVTGPNGSPCPGGALPFSPSLVSESTNVEAGAFTPLSTTLSREDGQQNIESVALNYPPGLSGIIKGIVLCPEAQANAGTCGQASLIGETTVSVGLGGDPFTVTGGKVYLTEKYAGAPFGLSIVTTPNAGPFILQEARPVVVRAKVEIDPHTAQLKITASGIPTMIEGIPLQIKHVNVTITRPQFTINPTDCNPTQITGTVKGDGGAETPVAIPFKVTNCAALKFGPKFTAFTAGHTSKANGASLVTRLEEPKGALGTQANIKEVKVDLPVQLPSQLKTLQKACLASVFEANHAACPPESIVGHARVTTPLLPEPLTGPAYFVSHGNEQFPSLTLVLQGYGVTVELVGSTFIKKGITSSTFKATPDTPFEKFELTLPQGKYAALGSNLPAKAKGSFCGRKLKMPTLFVAQDGAEIHQSTPIHVTGCRARHAKGHRARHKRRRK